MSGQGTAGVEKAASDGMSSAFGEDADGFMFDEVFTEAAADKGDNNGDASAAADGADGKAGTEAQEIVPERQATALAPDRQATASDIGIDFSADADGGSGQDGGDDAIVTEAKTATSKTDGGGGGDATDNDQQQPDKAGGNEPGDAGSDGGDDDVELDEDDLELDEDDDDDDDGDEPPLISALTSGQGDAGASTASGTQIVPNQVSSMIIAARKNAAQQERAADKERAESKKVRDELEVVRQRLEAAEKELTVTRKDKESAESRAEELDRKLQRAVSEASLGDADRKQVISQLEARNKQLLDDVQAKSEALIKAQEDARVKTKALETAKELEKELRRDIDNANDELIEMEKLKDKLIGRLRKQLKAAEQAADSKGEMSAGGSLELEQRCKNLQERIGELEARADTFPNELVAARAEERKRLGVEFDKLKKKFSDSWKKFQARFQKLRTAHSRVTQESSRHDARARGLATKLTQAEKIVVRHKTSIASLEKQLSEAKNQSVRARSSLQTLEKKVTQERADAKVKLDAAEATEKKLEELQKDKDEWIERIAGLKAVCSARGSLTTSEFVSVDLQGAPIDEDFVVQWCRSIRTGGWQAIEGGNKKRYCCTVDDLGCVLKAQVTTTGLGLTCSALTPRVSLNPKLAPAIREYLKRDQASLSVQSASNQEERTILLTDHRIKVRVGTSTKNKAEFSEHVQAYLDSKSVNKFTLRMGQKSFFFSFMTKTPLDRDRVVLAIRAFNSIHQFREKQKKLPKAERATIPAPLDVVLMNMVEASTREGKVDRQPSVRERRMSRVATPRGSASASVRAAGAKDAEQATDNKGSGGGSGDGATADKDEATGSEKKVKPKKSKPAKRDYLSRYQGDNAEKEENFWSSSDDEDEGKNKIKIKIKSEAEMAEEAKKKAAEGAATDKPSDAAPAGGLGAPPGGLGGGLSSLAPPSGRAKTRKGSKRTRARSKGKKKGRKSGSSAGKKVDPATATPPATTKPTDGANKKPVVAPAAQASADAATNASDGSGVTTTPKPQPKAQSAVSDDFFNSLVGGVKSSGSSDQKSKPSPGVVSPIQTDNDDPLSMFLTPSASVSKNKPPGNAGLTCVVRESVQVCIKRSKIASISPVSAVVSVEKADDKGDGKQCNRPVELVVSRGKAKSAPTELAPFSASVSSTIPGTFSGVIDAGSADMRVAKYVSTVAQNDIPLLAQVMWKVKGSNAQMALRWKTGAVQGPAAGTVALRFDAAAGVTAGRGRSGIWNVATKKIEWSREECQLDAARRELSWKLQMQGNQTGQVMATVRTSGKELSTATQTSVGFEFVQVKASRSLSGVEVADARGRPLDVRYETILKVAFD